MPLPLRDTLRNVFQEYLSLARRYTRNGLLSFRKVTAAQAASMHSALRLAEFYEAPIADWLMSQFYWWGSQRSLMAPLDKIGFVGRYNDSASIFRKWISEGRPGLVCVAPLTSTDEATTIAYVARRFDAARRRQDIYAFIMESDPTEVYYLLKSQSPAKKDYARVASAYLGAHKTHPNIGLLSDK